MATSSDLTPQEERELAQAILVQHMSPEDRAAWWSKEFAAVQASAQLMMPYFPVRPGAISFATMAEKNRYDEKRELDEAMNHSLIAKTRLASDSS
jgi:hypothetical protein